MLMFYNVSVKKQCRIRNDLAQTNGPHSLCLFLQKKTVKELR